MFYKNGKVVPAYEILHQRNALHTDIGLDGAIATAEIRPEYSSSIYKHLTNVLMLKARIQNLCNIYRVNALASPIVDGRSLGGHIHVSTNARKNITQEMVEVAIKLQFLLLPTAHFIYGRSLFSRYKNSGFKYGSPYDVRSDWGKNHIEMRMLPTFLGLNDKNVYAIFNYVVEGFVYLLNNDVDVPIIKKTTTNPSPLFFMNSQFPNTEAEFLKTVEYMRDFIYDHRIGFAIKLMKNVNKHNTFIVARASHVTTLDENYLGIVYYLSQLKPRKDIVLKHGSEFKVKKSSDKTIVYIDEKISKDNYFTQSKKISNKILKLVD